MKETTLGPFEANEALQIERLLEELNIRYQVYLGEELQKSCLQNHHQRIRALPTIALGSLHLAYIFFLPYLVRTFLRHQKS